MENKQIYGSSPAVAVPNPQQCCSYWRNDAIENAAVIAERYSNGFLAQDIRAMLSTPTPPSADHIPDTTKMVEQPDSAAVEPHSDDIAVDRFAALMKSKLAAARGKGRGGWDDPEQCPVDYLAELLGGHVMKNNDGNFVDIANFCMMLTLRNAHPDSLRLYAINSWKEMINRALGDESPYATKPQRITEQDAREIAQSFLNSVTKDISIREWVTTEGSTLLAKLNEHREPDYKAQKTELLRVLDGASHLNSFRELNDYLPTIRAAIAKHEGGK